MVCSSPLLFLSPSTSPSVYLHVTCSLYHITRTRAGVSHYLRGTFYSCWLAKLIVLKILRIFVNIFKFDRFINRTLQNFDFYTQLYCLYHLHWPYISTSNDHCFPLDSKIWEMFWKISVIFLVTTHFPQNTWKIINRYARMTFYYIPTISINI